MFIVQDLMSRILQPGIIYSITLISELFQSSQLIINTAGCTYIVDKVERQRHAQVQQSETLAVDCDGDGHVGTDRVRGQARTLTAAVRAVVVRQQLLASLHVYHCQSARRRRCQDLNHVTLQSGVMSQTLDASVVQRIEFWGGGRGRERISNNNKLFIEKEHYTYIASQSSPYTIIPHFLSFIHTKIYHSINHSPTYQRSSNDINNVLEIS